MPARFDCQIANNAAPIEPNQRGIVDQHVGGVSQRTLTRDALEAAQFLRERTGTRDDVVARLAKVRLEAIHHNGGR